MNVPQRCKLLLYKQNTVDSTCNNIFVYSAQTSSSRAFCDTVLCIFIIVQDLWGGDKE